MIGRLSMNKVTVEDEFGGKQRNGLSVNRLKCELTF